MAHKAPADAADVLIVNPEVPVAEEKATVVANPTAALLLETDDDAGRLSDRDRATAPGALDAVGINESTAAIAPVTSPSATPAPRAGTLLGTGDCEDDACSPEAFALGAGAALDFAFASWRSL